MLGDAVKSFFKRSIGIASGRPWFPFDQIDFIIGGTIFALPFIPITLSLFVTALLITIPLSMLVNLLSFKLKLKETWW